MSKIALYRTKSFLLLFLVAVMMGGAIAFAIDSDNDGMSDLYENFFSLNPASDDSDENDDSDELDNLAEAAIWTDPKSTDTDADGFPDHADSNALSRAVFYWGDASFTSGDEYSYTGPAWWTGAGKVGGDWVAADGCWRVATNGSCSLYIDLDRSILTNNLVLAVSHLDVADSLVSLSLLDTNGIVVAAGLGGDLTAGSGEGLVARYVLPMADYPMASRIQLDVETGSEAYRVYASVLYIDEDGDGLDSDQELQIGTSDALYDTDFDLLSDYIEVFVSKTDPLGSDTDGDGLGDGYELEGSRYQLIAKKKTWHDAKAQAELYAGHLAVITSEEEHLAIKAALPGFFAKHPWIGLTDGEEEGVWKWITGEPFDYNRWAGYAPRMGWADYAHYNWAKWVDNPANQKRTFLIEYETPLDPLNDDFDGDGLTDGDEMNVYGTSPFVADADNDGLSDGEEIAHGTDPIVADTDGDGLSDGEEVLGSRYQLVAAKKKWNEAKALAEACGGHLAVVTSEEEHSTITNALPGMVSSHPWIGLTDIEEDGVWKWITGEPFDYNRWAAWAPRSGWAHYGHYYWAYWQDNPADSARGFLIEYETPLDPLNPDTDGDGLSDGEEWNLNYSPYAADADADGLNDSEENTHGTDPLSSDTDGDGIFDPDEVALGLNPLSSDTDSDGYSDPDEIALGWNPADADTDGDGLAEGEEISTSLTDPLSTDSNSNGTPDRVEVQHIRGADFLNTFTLHFSSTWSTNGDAAVVGSHHGKPWVEYELVVPEAGMYHLGIRTERASAVLSEDYESRLQIDIDDCEVALLMPNGDSATLPEYSMFTPWLDAGTNTLRITLRKGLTDFNYGRFEFHAVELGTIDGEDADGDGIADWMNALLANGSDTDGDGISDADEILVYGSSVLNADTDGDGLDDGDEITMGTDLHNADSDGDGVTDGQEVRQLFTNPGAVEFDGTVTLVDSVSGAQTNASVGSWEIEGSEIVSKRTRGSVSYAVDFPTNDLYRLTINAAHNWNKSSCSPVIPQDTSAFLVYVDDVYVGKYPLVSADGVYVDVQAFLPVMPAGEHIVKLYWENIHSRLSVRINELKLESLGGSDANGNGTKDWVEVALSAIAGVDTVAESYVSPACIEGDARYVAFAQIVDVIAPADGNLSSFVPVEQSAGPRWYANLPLDQDDVTTATASFQNGALDVPISVEWTALNLMEHDGETIYVRAGDMVKFVALPEEANGGQFEIEYTLGMDGETVRSPNTRPLIYLFPSAGTYTVTGEYTHGNDTVTASIQVVALDGSLPEESPACLVGKEREWSFEGMSSNLVYEVDDTVEMSVVEQSLTTNNNQQTTVMLKANDTNGEHTMLARIPGGAILDSTELNPFWLQNAVDGYFYTVERYEDSELWEVHSIAKNVPDSVDIQIKVIEAGVTFDDYTLERWITNSAYDDIGAYNFRLFHPNGAASTCHTFKLYQDGEHVGEAYTGGQDNIGDY